jgi:hypothetical protein
MDIIVWVKGLFSDIYTKTTVFYISINLTWSTDTIPCNTTPYHNGNFGHTFSSHTFWTVCFMSGSPHVNPIILANNNLWFITKYNMSPDYDRLLPVIFRMILMCYRTTMPLSIGLGLWRGISMITTFMVWYGVLSHLQSRAKSIRGKWRTSRLSCLALAILNLGKSKIS